MSNYSDANVVTVDALTLILHNHHALAAATEEVTKYLSGNSIENVADNAVVALETLDENASAIVRLRKL